MFKVFITLSITVIIIALLYIGIKKNVSENSAAIYILYHDQRSENIARLFRKYHWAHYFKLGQSKYFESAFWPTLLQKEHEWMNKSYVGCISYSLVSKQNLSSFPLNYIIKTAHGADVVTFYKFSDVGMITHAMQYHTHFEEVWLALLSKMGYTKHNIMSLDIPLYPCNCWMAKPSWMKRFLLFAQEAVSIMENDSQVRKLCYQNSNYNGKVPKKTLVEIAGKPYYTFHPFITERLPCFFFWINKAKVFDMNVGLPNFYY